MNRRTPGCAPLLALLAACGSGDGAVVRGELRADALPEAGGDTLHVRVAGRSERVPVLDGRFALEEVAPGAATLRFERGGDSAARMELTGVPERGTVELRGIRIDRESGLAFPASVALGGAETVLVNGLRHAARPLPARVDAAGTVLAAAGRGDAFLVRPADASLPDLRVVVGPLTETTTPDGDPVPPEELERGDSVTVVGSTRGAYVLASRVVAPRALALREAGAGEVAAEDGPSARPASAAEPEPSAAPVREESRGRDEATGRDDGRGKGKGRGGERGRGKGKGKGRG